MVDSGCRRICVEEAAACQLGTASLSLRGCERRDQRSELVVGCLLDFVLAGESSHDGAHEF